MGDVIYTRNCPKCGDELTTNNKHYFKKAVVENKLCLSCSLTGRKFTKSHKENLKKNHANVSGENNPFYGKSHTDETKKVISKNVSEKYKNPELRERVSDIRKEWHKENMNSFKGKTHSDSTKKRLSLSAKARFEDELERKRMSDRLIGNIPWNKDKTNVYSEEVISKMSNSAKLRILKYGTNQIHSYNPSSIPIIEEYGKANGYKFKHAENGGEYQVPKTVFFVDGYDEENNVVIEFDEKYHFKESQQAADKKRQDIIGNILKCKFIRIDEVGKISIFDYSI